LTPSVVMAETLSTRVQKGRRKSRPLRRDARTRDNLAVRESPGTYRAEQVRAGLPRSALDALADELGVATSELAGILGVSLRTLQRKSSSGDRLGAAASDRLARIRRIQAHAKHVFGDSDKAVRWLTTPSRPLNREIPLRLLDTDVGTQRVQEELHQIEFGMPI
jgi:putative toxin-antitoxin system antitoxin component (TIGR02293 family)